MGCCLVVQGCGLLAFLNLEMKAWIPEPSMTSLPQASSPHPNSEHTHVPQCSRPQSPETSWAPPLSPPLPAPGGTASLLAQVPDGTWGHLASLLVPPTHTHTILGTTAIFSKCWDFVTSLPKASGIVVHLGKNPSSCPCLGVPLPPPHPAVSPYRLLGHVQAEPSSPGVGPKSPRRRRP